MKRTNYKETGGDFTIENKHYKDQSDTASQISKSPSMISSISKSGTGKMNSSQVTSFSKKTTTANSNAGGEKWMP